MQPLVIAPHGILQGAFTPPGDKSVSHRAVMFGALSAGKSHYTHFLEAEDCLNTLKAFRNMGVPIQHVPGSGEITIEGVGLKGLRAPSETIDLGNSGTSIRLMLGILAGQKFEAILSGDESLAKRPMKRVTQPLKKMGAQIKGKDDGNFTPLTIRGGKLQGIYFDNKLSSAQVKSALLFAGMQAEGITTIQENLPSRDHTERFLRACGAKFSQEGNLLKIEKTESLKALQGEVPGDISSAAFFIVGAAMTQGSEIKIERVSLNPTRIGLLKVLERMGAKIQIQQTSEIPEPQGNLLIRGTSLKGTRIAPEEIPSLIDEIPILMIAMALAEGESLISGAAELRVKESDRLHSMVSNLKSVGGDADELPDGCIIRGRSEFQGGKVQSYYDHRTVMSFCIGALRSKNPIEIDDKTSVSTSFPTFFDQLNKLRKR